jgi:hypothetical protein
MQWIALVCVVFGFVNLAGLLFGNPSAAPNELVEKGKTYHIIGACLAEIGCYSEVVRIEQVRPDGWIDVKQCSKASPSAEVTCDDPWRINLAQASAIRPYTIGRAAN